MGVSSSERKAIISSLFRLNEIETGTIMIGKQNLFEIPLKKLRSLIAIIPLQSNMFNETIW